MDSPKYLLATRYQYGMVLYEIIGLKWIGIPWVPIALLGTAAAFLVGFRNNATYTRAWEARQIWGGIVNVQTYKVFETAPARSESRITAVAGPAYRFRFT